MTASIRSLALVLTVAIPSLAFGQDTRHDGAAAGAVPPASGTQTNQAANTMQMMQMMQQMMPMMQQMTQMMQRMQGMGPSGMPMTGMMPMQGGGSPAAGAAPSEANRAYMSAMNMMEGPMMRALQSTSDPEVAFVKAMIPHHQSAVDMAKTALQYAKDEKVKAWANDIIKAQTSEIAQFEAWLKQRGQ